jgi:hypothetical protein
MQKFPVKTSVLMIALGLSNVVWGGHHPPKENHPSGSHMGLETSAPVYFMAQSGPSFFEVNFSVPGLNIHFQIGKDAPKFNPHPSPALPEPPPTQENQHGYQNLGGLNQSNCTPVNIVPPMAYPTDYDFQSGCGSQVPVNAKPPKEPKPPKDQQRPQPQPEPQQPVDFTTDQPNRPAENTEYQCGDKIPLFEELFSDNLTDTENLIMPDQQVYYPGDALRIDLKIPKVLKKTIVKERTEVYLFAELPNGKHWEKRVDINKYEPDRWGKYFELSKREVSYLPKGDYRLALISKKPGRKSVNVKNWSRGFKGLLHTSRVKFSPKKQYDEEDTDSDRMIDCDTTGDGFCDESSTNQRRRGFNFFIKPGCSKHDFILPNKPVYSQRDTMMQLRPKFERGSHNLEVVLEGKADAYALVVPPEGELFVIPVPVTDADEQQPFFEQPYLDTSNFAQGDYQIALVLTEAGSDDASDVSNWYGGLSGLVSVKQIKIITDCDAEDEEADDGGKTDDNTDGDDFSDEPADKDEPVDEPIDEEADKDEPVDEPTDKDAVEEPDDTPVTEQPDDTPVTEQPDDTPVTEQPDDTPVTEQPDDTPVTTQPDDTPVTTQPDDTPVTTQPDNTPVTTQPDNTPVTTQPDDTPVTTQPDNTPVTTQPDDTPVTTQPDDTPATEQPDDTPATEQPDDTPATEQPDDTPATEQPDNTPATEQPDDTPATEQPDNTPATEQPDDTPATEQPDDTPATEQPDDTPATEQPDETPIDEQPVNEYEEYSDEYYEEYEEVVY